MGFSRFLQRATALCLGARSLCRADTTLILDPGFSAEVILYPVSPDVTIEVNPSPCSDHIFTVHKGGFITLYDDMSVAANENARLLYDFQDETYSFFDHGFTALKFHPDFPKQPYVYILYSAEPEVPWGDVCPENNTINGNPTCDSTVRLVRLKLDVTMTAKGSRECADFTFNPKKAGNKVVLMDGWCTSSATLPNGDLLFLPSGDLLLSAGSATQWWINDPGVPAYDICYEPDKYMPQGSFRAQRLDFLQGKVLRIAAASLLADGPLEPGDYTFAAIGLANPYAMTLDAATGDVYVGDVGSDIKDEINVITGVDLETGTIPNYGYPCVEGSFEARWVEWFSEQCDPTVDVCSLCDAVWACLPTSSNNADCDPNYRRPVYEYRDAMFPLDPNYPDNCASGSASVTALAFYDGGDGSSVPHNLVVGDRSYGCQWYFEALEDGKPDFETGPKVLAAMAGVTSHQLIGGVLYSTSDFGVLRNDIGDVGGGGDVARRLESASAEKSMAAAAANVGRHDAGMPTASRRAAATATAHRRAAAAGPITAVSHGRRLASSLVVTAALYTTGADGMETICEDVTCEVAIGATVRIAATVTAISDAPATAAVCTVDWGDDTPPTVAAGALGAAEATHTYTGVANVRTVVVTAADAATGAAGMASLTVLAGLRLKLTMTPASFGWVLGDKVAFKLVPEGFDPPLKPADVQWSSRTSHCVPNTCSGLDDCHFHISGVDPGSATGFSGTFTPITHELPSLVQLQGFFSWNGVTFNKVWESHSKVLSVVLLSDPPGMPIVSGENPACSPPCAMDFMAGITASFTAPDFGALPANPAIVSFDHWEYNTGHAEVIRKGTPLMATISTDGVAIKAVYAPVVAAAAAVPPPVLLGVAGYHKSILVQWHLSPELAAFADYVAVLVTPVADDGAGNVAPAGAAAASTVVRAGQMYATATVPAVPWHYTVALAAFDFPTTALTAAGNTLEVKSSADTTLGCFAPATPFRLTAVPGTVPAENYDNGGRGIGFSTTTVGTSPYRLDAGGSAPMVATVADGRSFAVSGLAAGDWLQFTVVVSADGIYPVSFVLAGDVSGLRGAGGGLYLVLNSPACILSEAVSVMGPPVTTPAVPGVPGAAAASVTVAGTDAVLTRGTHALRICVAAVGPVNLDSVVFAAEPAVAATPAPAVVDATAAPTAVEMNEWDAGRRLEEGTQQKAKTQQKQKQGQPGGIRGVEL